MIRFFGHWAANCVELTCMLAGALLFMQVPALTHAYAVGLQQVAQAARHDIDQREADARQYYHLPPDSSDTAVIGALKPVEPSNAQALQQSVSRAAMFVTTEDRIAAATPIGQPLEAVWDATMRPDADKLSVLRTSFVTYVPEVTLGIAAVIYGLVGLLVGGLLGHTCSAMPGAVLSSRRRNMRNA